MAMIRYKGTCFSHISLLSALTSFSGQMVVESAGRKLLRVNNPPSSTLYLFRADGDHKLFDDNIKKKYSHGQSGPSHQHQRIIRRSGNSQAFQ